MFEVRNVRTNETWCAKRSMGAAMDAADVAKISNPDEEFCVVELRSVYHTADSAYCLRPCAQVLSRAGDKLLDGWDRFRALRNKLTAARG